MTKNSKQPTESLQNLLNLLGTDSLEAANAYNRLRSSLVRFFILKGDGEAEEATDETLDRVLQKISDETKIADLQKYCFGVARFIFLERIKRSKKETEAVKEFYENDLLEKNAEENDSFSFLRECFNELPKAERQFLQRYFADIPYSELDKQRLEITVEQGISLNSLRLKIFRLRKRLNECLKNKLE